MIVARRMAAAEKHGRNFLGRGVVRLADLEGRLHPDPFHAWCPLCIKEQKHLKGTLKISKESLLPALLEHVLRANVSKTAWAARQLLETERITLIDGRVKVYQQFKVAELQVTDGIPFLNVLRSVLKRTKRSIYGSRDPWVLVDFYEAGEFSVRPNRACLSKPASTCLFKLGELADCLSDETSLLQSVHSGENGLPRSAHGEMRRIFETTRKDEVVSCRLLSAHVQDAIIVGKTDSLREPMAKLLKHPVMWLAPSLGYWNDLRKSLFREVSQGDSHGWPGD